RPAPPPVALRCRRARVLRLPGRGARAPSGLGKRLSLYLDRFDAYLRRIGVTSIQQLSPVILSAFIVERANAWLSKSTSRRSAGVLRVSLRYVHRQRILAEDLSAAVGWPQVYRLSNVPRSISWDEVNRVLAGVDRRSVVGRRNSLPPPVVCSAGASDCE